MTTAEVLAELKDGQVAIARGGKATKHPGEDTIPSYWRQSVGFGEHKLQSVLEQHVDFTVEDCNSLLRFWGV